MSDSPPAARAAAGGAAAGGAEAGETLASMDAMLAEALAGDWGDAGAEMSEADTLLTDAGDAMFEGRLDDAARGARLALELDPSSQQAHGLLVQLIQARMDWEGVVDAACDWAAACGPSPGQLSALLRGAYRTGSKGLALRALDGMCSVEVDEDEFAFAQACVADLGASAEAGRADDDDEAAAESAAAEPDGGAAKAAADAAAAPAPALAEAEGGEPGPAAAVASVFDTWRERCDGARAAALDRLAGLGAAAVARAGGAGPGAGRDVDAAVTVVGLCLGLLAADACDGGDRSRLEAAAAAWAGALADPAAGGEGGGGVGMLLLVCGSEDASAHCAMAVLRGTRLTAGEERACERACNPIVWRRCRHAVAAGGAD